MRNYLTMRQIQGILFLSLIGCIVKIDAGPANPHPFQIEAKDGQKINVFRQGSSPFDSFFSDENGYTIIQEHNSSSFVYATKDDTSGELVSSGIVVGDGNPKELGIPRKLRPSKVRVSRKLRKSNAKTNHRELSAPGGTLKNLVVLVRFRNHKTRILPTADDFDVVFNHEEKDNEHHTLAPTGSVRDVFRINSYGKFKVESKVYGWVDLPETEAYYAAGKGGFGTPEFVQALHTAMDTLRDDFDLGDFSQFDGNHDGKVDVVTLIHSGYAAETSGADVDGAESDDRIWSHHKKLLKRQRWYPKPNKKRFGASVNRYTTAPALYGTTGSAIGRVGVICHEIGHVIGLPDLYGTSDGNGIGSFDFMSNHWGFPPSAFLSQLYPPILSPWSKMKVGWLDPIVIDKSGTFDIEASQLTDQIYRINMDSEGTEYLLIENRQAIGFDVFLPQAGLAVWHIDENALDVEGYPGQEDPEGILWPLNQKHYKVSLLQADGNYDLEHKVNQGDEFDLFHGDGIDFLAPSTNFVEGPYPSTDSYKDAVPKRTGIWIHDISMSGLSMSFSVTLMRHLSSPFLGGNGSSGIMFDVLPAKDIAIQKLYLNLTTKKKVNVELWTRTGTHISCEQKPWLWQRTAVVKVKGNGKGKNTSMDIPEPLLLDAGTRYGFYLVVDKGKIRYTSGLGVGNVAASNDDLTIYEGSGLPKPFGQVSPNRIWNGDLFYEVLLSDRN